MANLVATDKRQSVSWTGKPQVATFTIDFDASEFVNSSGQRIAYTSGDVVRLTDAIPTKSAMCVLASSMYQITASTAVTSSTIKLGFDGGTEVVSSYDGKTAATTKTNNALAAPVFGAAGTYLTLVNTIVSTGTPVKGKVTVSVVYCLV